MGIDFFRVLKVLGFPVREACDMFSQIPFEGDLLQWQREKADEIFRFHYKENEFYRNFVGFEPKEWTKIPVIKRADLKGGFRGKLPASVQNQKLYLSSTSGSSGDPLYFARDRMSHALVWLNVERLYNQVGLSVNHRQARMFGISRQPVGRLKARLKDNLSNRYRFNVFDLSDEAFEKWVQKFRRGRFTYIYGYTNSLVAFARFLKNSNITLADVAKSLRACIVTSEVCTEKDAQTLREALGVPVYNEYGSSELGVMGFKQNGFWCGSDGLLYFEVLDENDEIVPDGETGYLTCTALFNRATPFIRYRIGDLAVINRSSGITKIEKVMGSLNDMALLPSGKRVPGISFYFVAEELLDKSDIVKEFLFRQTSHGFVFEYVASRDLNGVEFDALKRGFDAIVGKGTTLILKRVEQLQRGLNGKFKHFISEL
ncbi:phenylacetate--CoA ligase family protein [Natronoflexus pectinivorans]|uniref:Phenylacetate-CoA ligase n=1 Tax=Natronoflexus pectinivorans TaxID=682526 RepID=A0A4V2RW52_9BACT|nr:phenylacetate--CoA ligase family protein [Natronoflexus pectinivorans]TCO06864.1 phenylacetate-CoA ligase [Natronoflexus pectinivorans]